MKQFSVKLLVSIFDALVGMYKKVCNIKKDDTQIQEIILFVVILSIAFAIAVSFVYFSMSALLG